MRANVGRKSNAPERRQQIVQALYQCLAQNGHERITIKGIAERAALPHGVIHYYFKSKDEIVFHLMRSMQEHYGMLWRSRILVIPAEKTKIAAGIDFIVDEMILDAGLNRVLYNLVQMGFERRNVRHELRNAYRFYRDQLANVFFPNQSPKKQQASASAILATIEGLALQWIIEPEIFTRTQVKKIMTTMLSSYLDE